MKHDEVDWATVESWQREGRAVTLLDVREAAERRIHHVGGLWIPLGEIMRRWSELPRDQTIVIYCRKGIRSRIAIQRLQTVTDELDLYNLRGGLLALSKP